MRKPASPMKSYPSLWAVALFCAASAFTLASLYLLSGELSPYW